MPNVEEIRRAYKEYREELMRDGLPDMDEARIHVARLRNFDRNAPNYVCDLLNEVDRLRQVIRKQNKNLRSYKERLKTCP